MPKQRKISMALNRNSLELNSKSNSRVLHLDTSSIEIEESPLLMEIKQEDTSKNSLKQEEYVTAANAIKKENQFLTDDCSNDEHAAKIIRDKENNFVFNGNIIVDSHSSGIKIKEETQFISEESMEEEYFNRETFDPLAIPDSVTGFMLQGKVNFQDDPQEFQPFSNNQQTNLFRSEGKSCNIRKAVIRCKSFSQLTEGTAARGIEHNFQSHSVGSHVEEMKENYDENNVAGSKVSSEKISPMLSTMEQISCPFCSMKFCVNERKEYLKHINTHSRSPLVCPVCPKEFMHQHSLMCHLRIEHLKIFGKQWHQCGICKAQFRCLMVLAGHLKSLHTDRYFYRAMCKNCLYKLEQDHQLKRLLSEVDRNCRSVPQQLRGSRNSEPNRLVNVYLEDSRQENGEMCIEDACSCEMEAEGNSESKQGKKQTVHDEVTTNFSCPQCPAEFMWEASFVSHLSAHKRPILCPDCPAVYKTEKEFYPHLRFHKKQLSYRCNFCPSRFSKCCELMNHFRALHSDKYWSFDMSCFTEFDPSVAKNDHSPEYEKIGEQMGQLVAPNRENSANLVKSPCANQIANYEDFTETVQVPNLHIRSEQQLCSVAYGYKNSAAAFQFPNAHIQSDQGLYSAANGHGRPRSISPLVNHDTQSKQKMILTAHSQKDSTNGGQVSSTITQTRSRTNQTTQSYQCPFCHAHFINRWLLTTHLTTIHTNKLHPFVGKEGIQVETNGAQDFSRAQSVENSLSVPTSLIPSLFIQLENVPQTNEELYLCQFCPAQYLCNKDLMRHLTTFHQDRYFSSFTEGNIAKTEPKVDYRNLEPRTGQSRLSYFPQQTEKKICPTQNSSPSILTQHLMAPNSNKNSLKSNSVCIEQNEKQEYSVMQSSDSGFSSNIPITIANSELKSTFQEPHEFEESCSSEKLYFCEFCFARLNTHRHLMEHFTAQHPDKYLDPALFVPVTERKRKRDLLNINTGTERLTCPDCSAEFIWGSSMINHMRTHDTDF